MLLAAGTQRLKQSSIENQAELSKIEEEALVVRALLRCNIPKLLTEDIPLFKGIVVSFKQLKSEL